MTTIIDVAKRAGVSFKTVSRVLNGEASVREQTREKVLKAASEMNYQLNASARNLRAKELPQVALLGENPSRSFVEAMTLGAMIGCQTAGYRLRVDGLTQRDRIISLLQEKRLVGVVLAPPLANAEWILSYLNENEIAYVRVCAEKNSDEGHKISIDDRAAARDMTNYLIGLGHRRIAMITGHPDYDASRRRMAGFHDAMEGAGLEVDPDLVRDGRFSFSSGVEAAEALLQMEKRPTAIFAANDDMAAACLMVAYKYGIDVPGALSVAGFDDSPIGRVTSPELTTVRQALPEMTEWAIRILAQARHNQGGQLEDIKFDHELIIRSSTASPATAHVA